MIIANFSPFSGQHCETTATGNLLQHLGVTLSEPMLFGLGEGLGFVYWKQRSMEAPFLGGRSKPDCITRCLAANLQLALDVRETASVRTAWEQVRGRIDSGIPVGLKLDSYYLDYFTQKIHFAAHYVALYGYDSAGAYLVDTRQQGGAVTVPLASLERARNARGPMASKNLAYTLRGPAEPPELAGAIRRAIRQNAAAFLNPPIANLGYRGIEKASRELVAWAGSCADPSGPLRHMALLMERGGTGGALFRNLYRDFLGQSLALVDDPRLERAHARFCQIAPRWTEVARLLQEAAEKGLQPGLTEAAALLQELAGQEKAALEPLLRLEQGD